MDFELNEEHRMIQATVRDFAENEILPRVPDHELTGEFPLDLFQKMAALGLLGLPFPEEYGGAAADTVSYAVTIEELARVSASIALSYLAHVSLGSTPIYLFGTEAQKQAWLVPCASGRMLAALGLTEPDAGSDTAGIQTRAVLDGEEWVINGRKSFITNGSVAGVMVITAVTGRRPDGRKEISCFLVPADAPGFKVGQKYEKLGLRASDTAELVFEDCRIPRDYLLGQKGEGLHYALRTLDGGRIGIAAMATGIAQACLEASLRYARERVQFGKPLASFQAIQFKLADMATNVELARLATYRAAWLKDAGRPFTREASIAKLFASEAAMEAAHQAVQIHGGFGYMKEYPVERYFRDARLLEIGEGTSEIQRLVIARQLGCR